MPSYEGELKEEFAPQLRAGRHLVQVSKVVAREDDSVLIVLSNKNGEAAQFIPADVFDPNPVQGKPKAWIFRRFVSAFDYPSEDYWTASERESRKWDVVSDAEAIAEAGYWAYIETEGSVDASDRYRARIVDMRSPRRNAVIELNPDNPSNLYGGEADDGTPAEVPF